MSKDKARALLRLVIKELEQQENESNYNKLTLIYQELKRDLEEVIVYGEA